MTRKRTQPNWAAPAAAVALDGPCGHGRRLRDLVECGETWHRLAREGSAPDNAPRDPRTPDAIRELCTTLLDPLEEALGAAEITYGFASPALTRHIGRAIAPDLDQHAAFERRADGRPVCPRGGFAVDLRVAGRLSREVAGWIVAHVSFDRLYLYGDDRPLHVSLGPQNARTIVEMRQTSTGRRVPRRMSVAELLSGSGLARLPGS